MLTPDQRFQRCVGVVCGAAIEGGYSDDPDDGGGPTNHGITLATLTHWRGRPCTAEDVQNLGLPEATAIYRALFWTVIGGDSLPSGVDLISFDAAVNQGPGTAAIFLQKAAGVVADGHVGPITVAAVLKATPSILITDIAAERMTDYQEDSGWDDFGRGWTNRVNSIKATALAWIGS